MDNKEMEDRMMAEMNQPTNVNLTPEAMREMNGFDNPTEEEGLSPKRR